MSFFSRNNRPATRIPPIGDGTALVFEEVFKDGQPTLVVARKDNLFEFVQASKEECCVYNIISRYQRGDVNALNQRPGQYVDVTGMPTNMMDAYAVMRNAQRKFDELPEDVRAKFNNDFNLYLQTIATAKLEPVPAQVTPTVDATVKGDEE